MLKNAYPHTLNRPLLIALLIGLTLFLGLGAYPLLEPDESFYALSAKEMLVSGDHLTPTIFGFTQFEKPILYYYLLVKSFQCLGVSSFAARLPGVLCGAFSCLLVYLCAKWMNYRRRDTLVVTAIYASCGYFIATARVTLTDIFLATFLLGAWASQLAFMRFKDPRSQSVSQIAFYMCIALAFLTKGLLAFVMTFLPACIYHLVSADKNVWRIFRSLPGVMIFLLVAGPWNYLMWDAYGMDFIRNAYIHENIGRFFSAEHARLNTPLFYPALAMLVMMPWSISLVMALRQAARHFRREVRVGRVGEVYMWSVFIAGFLFYTSAQSKLPSYVFPLCAPLCLIACRHVSALYRSKSSAGVWFKRIFVIEAGLLTLIVITSVYLPLAFGIATAQIAPAGVVTILCVILFWACTRATRYSNIFPLIALKMGLMLVGATYISMYTLPALASYVSMQGSVNMAKYHDDDFDCVLASKHFIRGATFYAQQNAAAVFVAGNKKSLYYTPHQIPILGTRGELLSYLKDKNVVLVALRPKEYSHWRNVLPNLPTHIILKNQELIVFLTRAGARHATF